jgi:catechol 2,3-dioxygenase
MATGTIWSAPIAQLTHVGLYVQDLDRMVDFYSRLFGMVVTDRSDDHAGRRIAFLTRNAEEHHQMVLISGRFDGAGLSPINQISFRVPTLEDLQSYFQKLNIEGVTIQRTLTHGNAWSIYFFDPEENRLELYCGSPWYVIQPFAADLDLSEAAELIRAKTEALIRGNGSKRPQEAWSAELKLRLQQQ